MNGTTDKLGKTAGLLEFRGGRSDAEQMSLFDAGLDDDSDDTDDETAVERPASASEPPQMRVPQDDTETQCRTSDPDVWFEPRFYPYLADVCLACPFRQWCATEALSLTAGTEYRVVGVWAGIDFKETDRGGRYRRRIQRLEHIALTGTDAPRRRKPKKPSVAA
jgi:hypothetical protein